MKNYFENRDYDYNSETNKYEYRPLLIERVGGFVCGLLIFSAAIPIIILYISLNIDFYNVLLNIGLWKIVCLIVLVLINLSIFYVAYRGYNYEKNKIANVKPY